MSMVRRVIGLVAAVGALVTAAAAPAGAFGVVVADGAAEYGQTALVWWDGERESVDVTITLDGQAADAAWVIAAPTDATITRGDGSAFAALDVISEPKVQKRTRWWPPGLPSLPGDGAETQTRSPVPSTAPDELGPLSVDTLPDDDARSIDRWLAAEGLPAKPGLQAALDPYLDQGWKAVAVRLEAPTGGELTGALPTLRLSFETETPIYPYGLTAASEDPQRLRLYVGAPHRLDIATEAAPSDPAGLNFAGPVDPAVLGRPIAETAFLTRYDATTDPADVVGDFGFVTAATDDPVYRVVYDTTDLRPVTSAVLILLLAGVGWFLVRRRHRHRRASSHGSNVNGLPS